MILAKDKGVQRLQLETDGQELVKLWRLGRINDLGRISPIIRETRELCLSFHAFELMYSSRIGNRVAHTLAKQVSGDNMMVEWQCAPYCAADLVTVD